MSDGWGPESTDGGTPDWSRPADGPVPGGVEPALTLESEGTVERGASAPRGARVVAALIGVALLAGGTAFAATQIGSSGPGTAEEAVQEMLDAAGNEDVLGLLAALDPGERDALKQPVEDMFAELERLEVVDPSLELTGIEGIDFEFSNVELRSEPVRDDLVRVYFVGGTVTSSVDGETLPIGDFVEDTIERFDGDISDLDDSTTEDLQDDDSFLVAHKGSEGWRVSIGYSIAEAARLDAGLPMPGGGITPIGAESPEAAVDGLAHAVADLDLRGMIARLSPAEMAALQDYAGLFIDEAEAELAEASSDVDIVIDDLQLRSDVSGNRASVFVDRFDFTVDYQGEKASVGIEGDCFTLEGALVEDAMEDWPFGEGPVCADDMEEMYTQALEESGLETTGDLPTFPSFETPSLGITTMEVDGQWYVAPVSTYMDGTVAVLRVLERSHLDAMVDFVEEMMTMFTGSYEESFSEVGEALPEDYYEPGEFEYGEGEFGEIGEAVPLQPDMSFDYETLLEMARSYHPEEVVASCVADQLTAAPPDVVYSLVDAWEYDYQPPPESQQYVFDALSFCDG
jgi:hypothetical protein